MLSFKLTGIYTHTVDFTAIVNKVFLQIHLVKVKKHGYNRFFS